MRTQFIGLCVAAAFFPCAAAVSRSMSSNGMTRTEMGDWGPKSGKSTNCIKTTLFLPNMTLILTDDLMHANCSGSSRY